MNRASPGLGEMFFSNTKNNGGENKYRVLVYYFFFLAIRPFSPVLHHIDANHFYIACGVKHTYLNLLSSNIREIVRKKSKSTGLKPKMVIRYFDVEIIVKYAVYDLYK